MIAAAALLRGYTPDLRQQPHRHELQLPYHRYEIPVYRLDHGEEIHVISLAGEDLLHNRGRRAGNPNRAGWDGPESH
jgi:hypothetical protein